eukprot:scaffold65755_cov24-Tisochrysis_lutea.AAC.1
MGRATETPETEERRKCNDGGGWERKLRGKRRKGGPMVRAIAEADSDRLAELAATLQDNLYQH